MDIRGPENQGKQAKQNRYFIDRVAEVAMRSSRRGFLGWVGKAGIAFLGGSAALEASTAFAATGGTVAGETPNLGCPECWGPCNCYVSSCIACNTQCSCNGPCGIPRKGGESKEAPDASNFRAHLLWIFGYIPNCTCPSC